MTAYTDTFLADFAAAVEARGGQIVSRQIEALVAVTAARLEAQEARLGELDTIVERLAHELSRLRSEVLP